MKGLSPFLPVMIIKNISQLNVRHAFQPSYPKHDINFSRFTDTHLPPFSLDACLHIEVSPVELRLAIIISYLGSSCLKTYIHLFSLHIKEVYTVIQGGGGSA